MIRPKPIAAVDSEYLSRQWDELAAKRHAQIEMGLDISFKHVSAPAALQLLSPADLSCVLEIGCGTGHFTAELLRISKKVVAVDPSARSIEIARHVCRDYANVRFVPTTLEQSVEEIEIEGITSAVALMTLMTVPQIDEFAFAVGRILRQESIFAAVFCHPWFWPRYWGYEVAPWFSYSKEIYIEANFSISKDETEVFTTHIHRPLERYVRAFEHAGFELQQLIEPFPDSSAMSLYPRPWEGPRFIGVQWRKRV